MVEHRLPLNLPSRSEILRVSKFGQNPLTNKHVHVLLYKMDEDTCIKSLQQPVFYHLGETATLPSISMSYSSHVDKNCDLANLDKSNP